MLRTSVDKARLSSDQVVRAYKRLAKVEQAFRSFKTVDLQVRRSATGWRTGSRCHFFLCMLSYYVLWHLKRAWRPLLFADEVDTPPPDTPPVAPAKRSQWAERKARSKQTAEGLPAHSFQSLLSHLATLTRNTVRLRHKPDIPSFPMLPRMTPVQQRAFELINVKP